MKKLKVWLVVAGVFVAGFAAGVVVTRGVVRHLVQRIVLHPERLRVLVEKRLTTRLRLDTDQHRKVDQILTSTEGELKSLRQEFAPRFVAILTNAESEISGVLTPEQRERFKKFREENRQLWQPKWVTSPSTPARTPSAS
jgi:hypothetical protein